MISLACRAREPDPHGDLQGHLRYRRRQPRAGRDQSLGGLTLRSASLAEPARSPSVPDVATKQGSTGDSGRAAPPGPVPPAPGSAHAKGGRLLPPALRASCPVIEAKFGAPPLRGACTSPGGTAHDAQREGRAVFHVKRGPPPSRIGRQSSLRGHDPGSAEPQAPAGSHAPSAARPQAPAAQPPDASPSSLVHRPAPGQPSGAPDAATGATSTAPVAPLADATASSPSATAATTAMIAITASRVATTPIAYPSQTSAPSAPHSFVPDDRVTSGYRSLCRRLGPRLRLLQSDSVPRRPSLHGTMVAYHSHSRVFPARPAWRIARPHTARRIPWTRTRSSRHSRPSRTPSCSAASSTSGMVRDIVVDDARIAVRIVLTTAACPLKQPYPG